MILWRRLQGYIHRMVWMADVNRVVRTVMLLYPGLAEHRQSPGRDGRQVRLGFIAG